MQETKEDLGRGERVFSRVDMLISSNKSLHILYVYPSIACVPHKYLQLQVSIATAIGEGWILVSEEIETF